MGLRIAMSDEIKERRFVAYYIANGGHGTKAAVQAGYSARSARTIAWRLKQKPHVIREIKLDREAQFESWYREWKASWSTPDELVVKMLNRR